MRWFGPHGRSSPVYPWDRSHAACRKTGSCRASCQDLKTALLRKRVQHVTGTCRAAAVHPADIGASHGGITQVTGVTIPWRPRRPTDRRDGTEVFRSRSLRTGTARRKVNGAANSGPRRGSRRRHPRNGARRAGTAGHRRSAARRHPPTRTGRPREGSRPRTAPHPGNPNGGPCAPADIRPTRPGTPTCRLPAPLPATPLPRLPAPRFCSALFGGSAPMHNEGLPTVGALPCPNR